MTWRDLIRQLVADGWRVDGGTLAAPDGVFIRLTVTGLRYAAYLEGAQATQKNLRRGEKTP